MRFKLVGNEIAYSTKGSLFGIFTKTEKHNEFKILSTDEVDEFLKMNKSAYSAAFGSFDLFRVAKGFAANADSRFSVVGFFLNKSGETPDKQVFAKVHSLSDINDLWDALFSTEMTSDYTMMRSVVLRDKMTGERIILEGYFDMSIVFKDDADTSAINDFSNEFLKIMEIAIVNDDFGQELDRLFVKSLEKHREMNS